MKAITDQQMDSTIGNMLRYGVTLSAIVVFLGGVLYLRNTATTTPDYSHFHTESASLRDISAAIHGAVHLDALSVIQLGILLLIATPVVRVVFCIVGFALEKDRLYVVISASVFIILMYSLFFAGRW
jgi:uncharacterized membrane protein